MILFNYSKINNFNIYWKEAYNLNANLDFLHILSFQKLSQQIDVTKLLVFIWSIRSNTFKFLIFLFDSVSHYICQVLVHFYCFFRLTLILINHLNRLNFLFHLIQIFYFILKPFDFQDYHLCYLSSIIMNHNLMIFYFIMSGMFCIFDYSLHLNLNYFNFLWFASENLESLNHVSQ